MKSVSSFLSSMRGSNRQSMETLKTLVWCMVAVYAAALVPADALAATTGPATISLGTKTGDPITDLLCNVTGVISGKIGTAIATLAIIIVGVGALMGKVAWGMAIIVGLGVAVVFGAPAIVKQISGQTGCANI